MTIRFLNIFKFAGVFCLLSILSGCMGWVDILASKHRISADYYLMQGESDTAPELYLFARGYPVSIAGPLHRIGWNQHCIIFTDNNWPKPWNVIQIDIHKKFTITENQRATDKTFNAIVLYSPAGAWAQKNR